jgi:uncharacterized protein
MASIYLRVAWWCLMMGLWVAAAAPPTALGQALSAHEIMRRNYFATRMKDSKAEATMTLITEGGRQRVRRLVSITKLREDGASQMRLARFLYPPDVKGTATLLIEHPGREDDMWVYIPALGKVRRLVSKSKGESYVGTDFTYGDIIGHKVDDYTHRIVGSETIDEAECYVVESVPVSEGVREESGYGRRVSWIRKDNFVSPKQEGYDLQGKLFKRLIAQDIRQVDVALGRWQPMVTEMINLESRHRTVLAYQDFKANVGVEQALFTTRSLEKDF